MTQKLATLIFVLMAITPLAQAQQSEMFGPFELHYSVVNTTFLDPKVAETYGLVRGEKRAILNLAVREHIEKGGEKVTEARAMELKGKTWDLIQSQALEFQKVQEGSAIYYIAEFKFIDEEWRFFEVYIRPEGADKTYTFKLKHQLYIN